MNLFLANKVETYHKLSEFNFVQAFIFLRSYFVNISSALDGGTSKGESGKKPFQNYSTKYSVRKKNGHFNI